MVRGATRPVKCGACGEQIALAKVCPYCGAAVKRGSAHAANGTSDDDRSHEERSRPKTRGQFKGRVHEYEPAPKKSTVLGRLARFFLDPRIPTKGKALVLAAFVYILSPVDLMPGGLFPLIGWVDDLIVALLAWRSVESTLKTFKR